MKKSFLVLLLILAIVIFPTFAFAASDKGESGKATSAQSMNDKKDKDAKEEKGLTDEEQGEKPEKNKEWQALKDQVEAEKDYIESLKDELELQKVDLEAQYEAAIESGDLELAETIRAELENIKSQMEAYKLEMKAKIQVMHEIMKQQYTAEEWTALQAVSEELSADPSLTVLEVENVYFFGGEMKFDTPPVIKDGRTLIPMRSISTALGAEVSWNNDERTALINYGENVIEFKIEEGVVYLNGEEAEIDVPAEIMKGRIVVPLRFVIENMGLNVEWEQDTQTIIISEEEPDVVEL